mgnify:FL=1
MNKSEDVRRIRASVRNRIVATLLLAVICCCTLVAAAKSGYTVDVVVDGKTIQVNTSEQDANEILASAGVKLGEDDKLDTSSFTAGKDASDGNKLVVLRAVPITIIDDGEEVATIKAAGNVSDALAKAGIICRKVDEMNYDKDDRLVKDMKIEIKRAFSIDVSADGKTQTTDFLSGTVADILKKLGIELGEDDEVSPSLTTELKPGNTVTVYRVSYRERTVSEVINYKTINRTSASLYKGTTQVEQQGKNGKKTVVYKDKIVDGAVSKSTVISEEIVTPVTNKIVVSGTKIKILSSGAPISSIPLPSRYSLSDGIPTNSLTTITGRSTSYTANVGAGTASGVAVKTGYVAVNPRQIPYGTEMYIVSTDGKYVYGYCIAADTGGFATNGSGIVVDLFMDTLGECRQWGSREVCIYVLKWGNGRV